MLNEMTAAEAAEIIERGDCGKRRYDAEDTAVRLLRAIVTGEFKPVVHAHWEQKDCSKWPICSNCGKPALSRGYCPVHSSYCPSCGAPMDEKGNSHA